eukprot:TRINITY_DN3137_c0_g1_i1.p1 TRINITY_DN3137_c0_g1~~TRINITY_DN3137_c0_g1_i1.p1  ORF type:complete len:469 (+),score=82.74 TRINITY_DN3137_c0_g1_i1:93-1409(+)
MMWHGTSWRVAFSLAVLAFLLHLHACQSPFDVEHEVLGIIREMEEVAADMHEEEMELLGSDDDEDYEDDEGKHPVHAAHTKRTVEMLRLLDPAWDSLRGGLADDASKYIPLKDGLVRTNVTFPARASSTNTLYLSGYWDITLAVQKNAKLQGEIANESTRRKHYSNVIRSARFYGTMGMYLMFVAESEKACTEIGGAYIRGAKSHHLPNPPFRFACVVIPFDELPFKKEAASVDEWCPSKIEISLGKGVLQAYNRIKLSKMFFTAYAAQGNLPLKFIHRNFPFFGWVDAVNNFMQPPTKSHTTGFMDSLQSKIRLIVPKPGIAVFPTHGFPGGLQDLYREEIKQLAQAQDWRLGRTSTSLVRQFFKDKTCGEPVVLGCVMLGTPEAIYRLYREYLRSLESIYDLTKAAVKAQKGCMCFDEEIVLSTTFLRCPDCFYFL